MKRMTHAGDCLDAIGKNHSIIVFVQTKASVDVNLGMEVTL